VQLRRHAAGAQRARLDTHTHNTPTETKTDFPPNVLAVAQLRHGRWRANGWQPSHLKVVHSKEGAAITPNKLRFSHQQWQAGRRI